MAKMDIVLIQIREREDVALQEQACFVERCGLVEGELRAHNAPDDPDLPTGSILNADAIIIGGSGVFSATEDYAFTEKLVDLVRRIPDRGVPLFGACWGHQFIARALGGRVETDDDRAEIGTHEIELTPNGVNDSLFSSIPSPFLGHMGHRDHVTALPRGAVELARTSLSPNQAFRIGNLPIYGAQFHAELSAERLIERLWIYRDIYAAGDGEFENMKRNARDTPDAERILRRWIDLCVRGRSG